MQASGVPAHLAQWSLAGDGLVAANASEPWQDDGFTGLLFNVDRYLRDG
jgi:hypothetical protein